jgi:zinc transporter ZupT
MKRNRLILYACIALVLLGGALYYANSGEVSEALHPTQQYSGWAFILGSVSAISLLFGSICGILFNPRPSITASLTAFGAGALLAALSVELIAPTVINIVEHSHDDVASGGGKAHATYTMLALLIGCVAGGLVFVMLDEIISSKGGFMRKMSTLIGYLNIKTLHKAHEHIEDDQHLMEHKDVHNEVKEHSGAPMSIWLGLLIDSIPESFVIGAGFLALLSVKIGQGIHPEFGDVVPYTLVAGLFLSNFPEALSSSIGMKKQGIGKTKIILLWTSLVLITGIGAVVGYYLGAEIPHEIEIGIEGLAAGAMLTMIAQTMIPEAVHIGGNKVVGLSVLAGYLSAVAFKLFE